MTCNHWAGCNAEATDVVRWIRGEDRIYSLPLCPPHAISLSDYRPTTLPRGTRIPIAALDRLEFRKVPVPHPFKKRVDIPASVR